MPTLRKFPSMSELQVLEAKVPVRTPVLVREEETVTRLAPIATWFNGPVFSRARDIFAANMTELLDRSEDPSKMIRMIILEMEETLVDVRASAARAIADIKEMRRACSRLDEMQTDWTAKAELALSKDREDLAKAALSERQKAADMAQGLHSELDQIEQVLQGTRIVNQGIHEESSELFTRGVLGVRCAQIGAHAIAVFDPAKRSRKRTAPMRASSSRTSWRWHRASTRCSCRVAMRTARAASTRAILSMCHRTAPT